MASVTTKRPKVKAPKDVGSGTGKRDWEGNGSVTTVRKAPTPGQVEAWRRGAAVVIHEGRSKPKSTKPPSPTSTSGSGTYNAGSFTDISNYEATFSQRFNPPPHNVSRSISPIAYLGLTPYYKGVGVSGENINMTNHDRLLFRESRGFIYQDLDSNSDKTKNSLWGFQFHYNPSDITYTNAQIDNIDWTNPANSKANLLVGNMTCEITLLLNRVWDIAALQEFNGAPGGKVDRYTINTAYPFSFSAQSVTKGYGRYVSPEDLWGIYTRGTEWDLEYLYRTVNGDPTQNPTVPDSLTSDWGFLSGVPVWIKLNDNMRWKVSITGLTVSHKQFTQNMVPMLSQVTIQMTRIPVITLNANDDQTIMKGRY